LTGGSPRYHLYPAQDGRTIVVGALEQKFWDAFCDVINLPDELRNDSLNPDKTIATVAETLVSKPSNHWAPLLAKADCCCTIVANMNEVTGDAHFAERRIFDHSVKGANGKSAPALPLPIVSGLRQQDARHSSTPSLGEYNDELIPE